MSDTVSRSFNYTTSRIVAHRDQKFITVLTFDDYAISNLVKSSFIYSDEIFEAQFCESDTNHV